MPTEALALFRPSITSSQGTRGENNAPGRAEELQDGAHGSSFMQGSGTRGQGGTCAHPLRHTRYTHLIPAHTCTYSQHTPAGSMHMSHTYQTHTCTHTGTLTPYPDTTDTQMQTHITLRGTPRTTDAQTHRDTCNLSCVIKQGVPLHPTVLGHIPGEPSLTPGLIKSGLQETRKLNLGPFLCSGYCA